MGLSGDKRQVSEHSGNFKEYPGKVELIVKEIARTLADARRETPVL